MWPTPDFYTSLHLFLPLIKNPPIPVSLISISLPPSPLWAATLCFPQAASSNFTTCRFQKMDFHTFLNKHLTSDIDQEDYDMNNNNNSTPENSSGSPPPHPPPPCAAFNDVVYSKTTSATSPKKRSISLSCNLMMLQYQMKLMFKLICWLYSTRRAIQKRVVSIPIKENSNTNTPPPSDSWAWRKYGQKPIKGSPYPR